MRSILVASSSSGSGKTSTAITLASYLQHKGKKVAFIKPVLSGLSTDTATVSDVMILKQHLNLAESSDILSPSFPDIDTLKSGLKKLIDHTFSGKDVVIIESPTPYFTVNCEVADFTGAGILSVAVFQYDAAGFLADYNKQRTHRAGVVINKVPGTRNEPVNEVVLASGEKVIGIVPEDRRLAGFSVIDLADVLNGKIISGHPQPEEFIGSFMLGALNPDHGSEYYARKADKAVILRSEKADMQLAALETSTKCLVLAGSKAPVPVVLNRAETRKIPVVTVNRSISEILIGLEKIWSQTGFSLHKVTRTLEHFGQYLDLEELYRRLT